MPTNLFLACVQALVRGVQTRKRIETELEAHVEKIEQMERVVAAVLVQKHWRRFSAQCRMHKAPAGMWKHMPLYAARAQKSERGTTPR